MYERGPEPKTDTFAGTKTGTELIFFSIRGQFFTTIERSDIVRSNHIGSCRILTDPRDFPYIHNSKGFI
jgi:hypothetical protein